MEYLSEYFVLFEVQLALSLQFGLLADTCKALKMCQVSWEELC